MTTERARSITEALLAVAVMVEADPIYIPVFLRLDAELEAETGDVDMKLAAIRAKIKKAA